MSVLRRTLRSLRAELLERSGANARARARLDGGCAAILMYHRVLPAAEARRLAVEPGMYVTPETFACQLDWLQESYRVLPLEELLARMADDAPLPEGACALTFDDGWRDNHVYAAPALAARGLPATVFVVSDRVGSEGAYWPDEVCRGVARMTPDAARALARSLGAGGGDPSAALLAHLKAAAPAAFERDLAQLREAWGPAVPGGRELLDWDELAELEAAGFRVASHGASHALLTRIDASAAADDLRRARDTLRERGFAGADLLAYPSGAHDAAVRALAREAGYRAALTVEPGLARPGQDPFALPRIGLHEDVSSTRAAFHRAVPGFGL